MVLRVTTPIEEPGPLADMIFRGAAQVPWEQLFGAGSAATIVARAAAPSTPSASKPDPVLPQTTHPGCDLADATLHVQGYLQKLGEGYGGYGVLALGKTQLEDAATTADSIGRRDVGAELRSTAGRLPSIRTKEAAEEMAEAMDPLVKKTWRMGRVCGITRR